MYKGDLTSLERHNLEEFGQLTKLRISNCTLPQDRLFQLQKASSESGFALILDGVLIKTMQQIVEYEEKSSLRFQLTNYSELEDDLHFVNNINYDEVVKVFPSDLPADLFTKYNNIEQLTIGTNIGSRKKSEK